MQQCDLFGESHLLHDQVGALIWRQTRVHPGFGRFRLAVVLAKAGSKARPRIMVPTCIRFVRRKRIYESFGLGMTEKTSLILLRFGPFVPQNFSPVDFLRTVQDRFSTAFPSYATFGDAINLISMLWLHHLQEHRGGRSILRKSEVC